MWWHGCDSCRDAVPWRSRVLLPPDETESGHQVPTASCAERFLKSKPVQLPPRGSRVALAPRASPPRLLRLARRVHRAARARSAFDARRRVSDAARASPRSPTPAPSSRARFRARARSAPRARSERAEPRSSTRARLLDDGERARRRVLRVPTAASIPGPLSRAPPRSPRLRRARASPQRKTRRRSPPPARKSRSGDKRLGLSEPR